MDDPGWKIIVNGLIILVELLGKRCQTHQSYSNCIMQYDSSLKPLNGHKGAVLCCCIHKNILISAGHDKKVIVWDVTRNTIKLEIEAHDHIINSLDVCVGGPDSDPYILSASWDRTVKVWDINSGELISTFLEHNNRVKSVKALPSQIHATSSPTNRLEVEVQAVASGDDDGHIYLWDLQTAQALLCLQEHNRFIVSLVTYSDSSGILCLVSASADGTIRLWDVSELTTALDAPHPPALQQAKTPSRTSICAIKTPSKHISCLCTASMYATAPLITGCDAHCATTHKTALPLISPARKKHTPASSHHSDTPVTISTTDTTISDTAVETLLLAADTLGSLFVYRARTGCLLLRLEALCRIVSLFATPAVLSAPFFPSEEDVRGYYSSTSNNSEDSRSSGGGHMSAERDALLAHCADTKRQHYIANKVVSGRNAHSTTAAASSDVAHPSLNSVVKYVYYVPDNGSVGCFCMLPDMYVNNSTSGGGSVDITTSISLTHTVKLDLCRAMSTVCGGTTPSTNTTTEPKRRKSTELSSEGARGSKARGSMAVGASAGLNRSGSSVVLGGADSEEGSGGGSGDSSVCVSGNNSAKSTFVGTSGSSGKGGGRVLQAFNSSAAPSSSKHKTSTTITTTIKKTNTITNTNSTNTTSSSSGGVMSVSILSADPHTPSSLQCDQPLLQCCAITSAGPISHTNNTTSATSTTHYMVFGGRDSILLSCAYVPSKTKSPAVGSEADNKTHLVRPSPIVLPRPGVLLTDMLTPTVSPVHKHDTSSAVHISAALSSSRSSNSAGSTPTHRDTHYTPHTPHMMHSPKKSDSSFHASHYTTSATTTSSSTDAAAERVPDGVQRMQLPSSRTHLSRTATGTTSTGSSVSSPVSRNSHTAHTSVAPLPSVPSAVSATTASTIQSTHPAVRTVTTTHAITTQPSSPPQQTSAEAAQERELEDEMSLSEVSHIHTYYDHLLHGRDRGAGNKTHLSTMKRVNGAVSKGGAEGKALPGYGGSMLEYLHMLDQQSSGNNIVSLGTHSTAATHTTTNPNNTTTCSATSAHSVSGYASVVSSSTLDPHFWQAANTALSSYSFRRIRLQSTSANPHNAGTARSVYDAHTTHSAHRGPHSAHPLGLDAITTSTSRSVLIHPGNATSAHNTMVHTADHAADLRRSCSTEHTLRALRPTLHSHHAHGTHTGTAHANIHPVHHTTNSTHKPHGAHSRSERLKPL